MLFGGFPVFAKKESSGSKCYLYRSLKGAWQISDSETGMRSEHAYIKSLHTNDLPCDEDVVYSFLDRDLCTWRPDDNIKIEVVAFSSGQIEGIKHWVAVARDKNYGGDVVERADRTLLREHQREKIELQRMHDIKARVQALEDEANNALVALVPERLKEILQKADRLPESTASPSIAQIRRILSMDTKSIEVLRAARAAESGDLSALVDMTMLLKSRKLQNSDHEYQLESIPVLRTDESDHVGRMSYSDKPLRQTMTKLASRSLEIEARGLFKNIMGFMGDFKFPFPALQGGQLLEACRQNPSLIAEVLCQILKQVNQSEEAHSAVQKSFERGMVLLGIFIAVFHPSPELENYVELFISKQKDFQNMRRVLHYRGVHQKHATVQSVSVKELEALWQDPTEAAVIELVERRMNEKQQ